MPPEGIPMQFRSAEEARPDAGSVDRALNEASKTVSDLKEAIINLRSRIEPILRVEPRKDQAKTPRQQMPCSLADAIHGIAELAADAGYELGDIFNRLEL